METTEDFLPLEIDVQAVKRLLDSGDDFMLLDCREPDEREFVKIEQAVFVPMGDIPTRVDELEKYRRKRIVVHCHFGGRSLQVVQWLRGQGFAHAQNMKGGIDAWSAEVDPSLPRY